MRGWQRPRHRGLDRGHDVAGIHEASSRQSRGATGIREGRGVGERRGLGKEGGSDCQEGPCGRTSVGG
jgi:hypothetical protein